MGDQELDELEAGKVSKGEDLMPVKVEYKGVHFKIPKRDGPDVHILKDVSGVCHPGRLLSIMGPSGAGKTTLVSGVQGLGGGGSGVWGMEGNDGGVGWMVGMCGVELTIPTIG